MLGTLAAIWLISAAGSLVILREINRERRDPKPTAMRYVRAGVTASIGGPVLLVMLLIVFATGAHLSDD